MKNKIVPISQKITEETHKPYILVDGETGEYLRTFYKRRGKNKNFKPIIYDENNPDFDLPLIPWKTKNMFIKHYTNEDLPEYESERFLVYWLKLSRKLSISTNVISRNTRDKGYVPMSEEEMIKLLNISERTFRDFIKESIAKYIIVKDVITDGKGERINYVMNPIYILNGSNLNMYTYELFKNDKKLQESLSEKFKEKIKEIYTIVDNVKSKLIEHNTDTLIQDIKIEKKINLENI